MKKLVVGLLAVAAIAVFAGNVQAGACDTNANSLGKAIDSKCAPKATVAEKCACAQAQFDLVKTKVPTCEAELLTKLNEKKAAFGCGN